MTKNIKEENQKIINLNRIIIKEKNYFKRKDKKEKSKKRKEIKLKYA